ncbi:hypothetical protein CBL_03576 [Carabus blaptoides fortunei]
MINVSVCCEGDRSVLGTLCAASTNVEVLASDTSFFSYAGRPLCDAGNLDTVCWFKGFNQRATLPLVENGEGRACARAMFRAIQSRQQKAPSAEEEPAALYNATMW